MQIIEINLKFQAKKKYFENICGWLDKRKKRQTVIPITCLSFLI